LKERNFVNLSKEDLVEIHNRIQERFATTTAAGISKKGLVDSIVKRPDQILYGRESFPDIYSKAASIMEATLRWHVFADGNKRTGLIATETYLKINGFVCIYPLDAVRFSVLVAATEGEEQEVTDNLIRQIADWLEVFVAEKTDRDKVGIIAASMSDRIHEYGAIYDKSPEEARKIMEVWFAADIYPEYKKEMGLVLDFLKDMYNQILEDAKIGETEK
jgi:death-on-curing protein